jgi:hypothetical protein
MADLTYAPRTEKGQDYADNVMGVLNMFPPVAAHIAPHVGAFMHKAPKGAKNVPEQAPKEIPKTAPKIDFVPDQMDMFPEEHAPFQTNLSRQQIAELQAANKGQLDMFGPMNQGDTL